MKIYVKQNKSKNRWRTVDVICMKESGLGLLLKDN